ncbi:unnamed protein product, partial [Closterium sp. NIES-53]
SCNVNAQVQKQHGVDPDTVFPSCTRTVSLREVFGTTKRGVDRRGDTGDWIQDRLTWSEEMKYKKEMGYL